MILTAKQHKKAAATVLIGACVVGGGIGYSLANSSQRVDTVRESQLRACQDSLKPGGVRFIIAQQIQDQIRQSHNIPASFFPNIPPKVFKRLVREQNAKRRAEVRQLLGIDCPAVYPSP